MKLLTVSVSLRKEASYQGKVVATGIFKEPVGGRVMLRTLNLDGDQQVDLKGHGGVYKAACVYTIENYDYWSKELGRNDFKHSQFGENFTVEGMSEDEIHVGDVFRIGDARVEVTQPRVPCYRLGIKMENVQFPKMFLQSCRVGFYFRVLQEGEVGAGDTIELLTPDSAGISVRDVCHLYYFDRQNLEDCKKVIQIRALSPGWREGFEDRLEKAGIAIDRLQESEDSMCCGPDGKVIVS